MSYGEKWKSPHFFTLFSVPVYMVDTYTYVEQTCNYE